MYSAIPFFVGVTVIAFAVVIVLTFIPAYRRGMARRYSRSVGLALPSHLEPMVTARLAARNRGASIGAVVAVLATLLLVANGSPIGAEENFASFVVVGGAFAGIAIGAGVSSALGASARADDQVRVARSQAVDVADYVAPFELVSTRVGVAIGALISLVAVVAAATPGLISLAAILSIVAILALVLFELASRRIVRRAQPVGTPVELAWDDALRAALLRDLITAPLALGAYALFIAAVAITDALADSIGGIAGSLTQIVILGILLLAGVALMVVSLVVTPQRHFLRRLWPDLAPKPKPQPQPVATDAA